MMSKDEVTNVGYPESQRVAAFPVLRPPFSAPLSLRQLVSPPLLLLDVGACALKYQGDCDHPFRIEPKWPRHKPFLDFALQLFSAARRRLERLAELELKVVHQPHARRRLLLLR